ncbi:hypothetical protein CHUAL_013271 [Chamberlinius hualienensis]
MIYPTSHATGCFLLFTLSVIKSDITVEYADCYPCHIHNRLNYTCAQRKEECGECEKNYKIHPDGSGTCYEINPGVDNRNRQNHADVLGALENNSNILTPTIKKNEFQNISKHIIVGRTVTQHEDTSENKIYIGMIYVGSAIFFLAMTIIGIFLYKLFKKNNNCNLITVPL